MRPKIAFICIVFIVALMAGGTAFAKPPTNAANLQGTWYNAQPSSGGVAKIVVSLVSGTLKVHAYGKCTPTLCDWGTVNGTVFSRSVGSSVAYGFSANFSFGYATTLVTAVRQFDLDGGSYLEVQTRTKFASGDTRYDYERIEMFRK